MHIVFWGGIREHQVIFDNFIRCDNGFINHKIMVKVSVFWSWMLK